MKLQFILLAGLVFTINTLFAQNARFPTSGVIEFEKTINMHAVMKRNFGDRSSAMMGDMFESIKKSSPQFKVLKSTLTFSGNKTFFNPIIAQESPNGFSFGMSEMDQPNITYTDLTTNIYTTQKKVFDETFLVKDTTRKINWKLTSEMRTIAGYECRRANALIMDSVYVVAFYTDKIPVSGGPESFTGLPGMILGLALPHDNITWFAKTVTDKSVPETEMKPPLKGKPSDSKGLFETMNKLLGKWGTHGNGILKTLML